MNKPSSTITAAFIASQIVVVIWAMVDNFTGIQVTATLAAESAALAGVLVGYYKKENVLK